MSINEDTKLEKGKEKRKIGSTVGLYKYLTRAAKALVVTETIVKKQYHTIWNCTRQYKTVYAVTLPPPSEKLALKLYMSVIIPIGRFLFLYSFSSLSSLLYQHSIYLFRYFSGPGSLG